MSRASQRDGSPENLYQSLPFEVIWAWQDFRVQTATSPAELGRNRRRSNQSLLVSSNREVYQSRQPGKV